MSSNVLPITSLARVGPASYGPKQLGLFATTAFSPHQDIAIEEPILSIRWPEKQAAIERTGTRFFKSVSTLSKKDLGHLKHLAYRCNDFEVSTEIKNFTTLAGPRSEVTQDLDMAALDAFFSYSWPLGPDDVARPHGLFREFSFLNHSCMPNATLIWHEEAEKMILHALEPIEKDQEIHISYLSSPFQTKQARHAELGFACQCRLCSSDNEDSEEVYSTLSRLWDSLKVTHAQLLPQPLPVDFRDADRGQIMVLASEMGPDSPALAVAQEFCRVASDLSIAHVDLARVYELISAAKLAWFLTHGSDTGIEKVMGSALIAKAKEIGILFFCTGLQGKHGENHFRQLWCMTLQFANRDVIFSSLLEAIGLEGEVEGDRMRIRMPR